MAKTNLLFDLLRPKSNAKRRTVTGYLFILPFILGFILWFLPPARTSF